MKFNVSSSVLFQTLQNSSKVLSSKTALPILESFLFEIKGDKLTITASDSEIILRSVVDIVNEDGIDTSFVVSSKRLLDSLKELSEQPVTFDIDTDSWDMMLVWASGNLSISALAADGYPEIKGLGDTFSEITLPCELLDTGFASTAFAAEQSNNLRPVMQGVLLEIEGDHVTFVATNALHLAKFEVSVEETVPEKVSLIIPAKTVNIVRSLCQKVQDIATVQFDPKNILFKVGDNILMSRLIEGNFPRYRQVIPASNPRRAVINRAAMLSAVKRVSVCTPASGLMMLSFTTDKVLAKTSDAGFSVNAEDTVAIQYNDEPLQIGFKAQYLIEALSAIDSEDVNFLLADETRPGVLVPAQQPVGEDYLIVLMPITLS